MERVYWDRRQAAPGGTVGLDVRTQLCGDGSPLPIQLEDAQGTVYNTLSGQFNGNYVSIDLSGPQTVTGRCLRR
jgi:hypothetical protein